MATNCSGSICDFRPNGYPPAYHPARAAFARRVDVCASIMLRAVQHRRLHILPIPHHFAAVSDAFVKTVVKLTDRTAVGSYLKFRFRQTLHRLPERYPCGFHCFSPETSEPVQHRLDDSRIRSTSLSFIRRNRVHKLLLIQHRCVSVSVLRMDFILQKLVQNFQASTQMPGKPTGSIAVNPSPRSDRLPASSEPGAGCPIAPIDAGATFPQSRRIPAFHRCHAQGAGCRVPASSSRGIYRICLKIMIYRARCHSARQLRRSSFSRFAEVPT